MNDFSFSQIFFKRTILNTLKNQGLFGKGLYSSLVKEFADINDRLPCHKILDPSKLKIFRFQIWLKISKFHAMTKF